MKKICFFLTLTVAFLFHCAHAQIVMGAPDELYIKFKTHAFDDYLSPSTRIKKLNKNGKLVLEYKYISDEIFITYNKYNENHYITMSDKLWIRKGKGRSHYILIKYTRNRTEYNEYFEVTKRAEYRLIEKEPLVDEITQQIVPEMEKK